MTKTEFRGHKQLSHGYPSSGVTTGLLFDALVHPLGMAPASPCPGVSDPGTLHQLLRDTTPRCGSQQAHAHADISRTCAFPHVHRRPVLRCRFWVLSATLNQTFNVWILTPEQTMKARQHNVYSKMFVVTEPLPECMNVYLPLASNGRDKAMCQHIYEALAAQPASGAPERTILNTSVRALSSSFGLIYQNVYVHPRCTTFYWMHCLAESANCA